MKLNLLVLIEDVESFVTMEDINTLHATRENLRRADFIDITEEMCQKLDSEMTRTGMGSVALLKQPGAPEGLKYGMVDSWGAGKAKTANPTYWNWVIDTYAALPDKGAKVTRKASRNDGDDGSVYDTLAPL